MNPVTLTAALLSLTVLPLIAVAAGLFGGAPGGSPSGISPDGSQINTLDSIGGSLVNGYGTWTFGPGMTPPTGAGPPGPFGYFAYVKLNGAIVGNIARFGAFGGRTGASQIVVDYGGNVFFLTTENDRQWNQFYNYLPVGIGSPTICAGVTPPCPFTSPAPPTRSPPCTTTCSPDGTTITSAPGTLTTRDGVWSNGSGGSSYQSTLNGVPFAATSEPSNTMRVDCTGNMFALRQADNGWSVFLGVSRHDYGGGAGLPTCPIPIDVTTTPNPALVVTGTNPCARLLSSTPPGTVVATIAVTTSNGSPFSGSLSLNNPGGSVPSWLTLSGNSIVTTGGPPGPPANYMIEVWTNPGPRPSPGAAMIQVIVQ